MIRVGWYSYLANRSFCSFCHFKIHSLVGQLAFESCKLIGIKSIQRLLEFRSWKRFRFCSLSGQPKVNAHWTAAQNDTKFIKTLQQWPPETKLPFLVQKGNSMNSAQTIGIHHSGDLRRWKRCEPLLFAIPSSYIVLLGQKKTVVMLHFILILARPVKYFNIWWICIFLNG